ncbi:MAG: hypothetical protein IT220_06380 [Flavobacteriaceae bacterium]|nr:hypothetical protein [Flavobacteriaceae bacterium]
MKKIFYFLALTFSLVLFNSCEEDSAELKYVSFESGTYKFGVNLDASSTREIKVYATKKMDSDRTFAIRVNTTATTADPTSYVVPTTVTIPADSNMGSFNVTISDVNLDAGDVKDLVIEFVGDEEYYNGNSITLKVSELCPLNEVFVYFAFDAYGEETSWELQDSLGNTVASGGEDGAYDGLSELEIPLCLEDGTYTLTVYDVYGDGMFDGNIEGSFKLYGGTTIYALGGGNFGESSSTTFSLP